MLLISTQEQLIDFLTKGLAPPKFKAFVFKHRVINIYHSQSCGRVLNEK